MKPTVLILVDYYLPGYKSGGPVRTIANMVDQLGDEFAFRIVTRDRDLGDAEPYQDIKIDAWNSVGKAQVLYCSPWSLSLAQLRRLIWGTPHDILYLNSFFSPVFTIRPLMLRRLGLLPDRPVLLAPRGEFSPGALQLKRTKKMTFIGLARTVGLYRDLVWHASSDYEAADIRRMMGRAADQCMVALDMPHVPPATGAGADEIQINNGPLRLIFLSRVSPKKNLHFALRVLARVKANIHFNIYGPVDADGYWEQCRELIDALPEHVRVTYHGAVDHGQVARVMGENHLFFLPTLGENYGHVVAEALSAGTPVLISDTTPWRNLAQAGVGWDLPLDFEDGFAQKIEEVAAMTPEAYAAFRNRAREYARTRLTDPSIIDANRKMFLEVLQAAGRTE